MMAREPLNYRVPITNPDGTPTTFFQRLWQALETGGGGGGGSGTVTSVGTAGTINGITLTGGPVTTAGTITLGGTLSGVNLVTQTTGNLALARGGIPTGGTTGQALVKSSNTDYDAAWATGSASAEAISWVI